MCTYGMERIIILDVGELHLKCDLLYDGKHKVLLQKTSVLDVFSHNLTSQEFQTGKHLCAGVELDPTFILYKLIN